MGAFPFCLLPLIMGGSSEARRLSDVSLPWAGEGFSAGGAEASAGTVIPKQSLFLRSIIRFSDDPGLIRLFEGRSTAGPESRYRTWSRFLFHRQHARPDTRRTTASSKWQWVWEGMIFSWRVFVHRCSDSRINTNSTFCGAKWHGLIAALNVFRIWFRVAEKIERAAASACRIMVHTQRYIP